MCPETRSAPFENIYIENISIVIENIVFENILLENILVDFGAPVKAITLTLRGGNAAMAPVPLRRCCASEALYRVLDAGFTPKVAWNLNRLIRTTLKPPARVAILDYDISDAAVDAIFDTKTIIAFNTDCTTPRMIQRIISTASLQSLSVNLEQMQVDAADASALVRALPSSIKHLYVHGYEETFDLPSELVSLEIDLHTGACPQFVFPASVRHVTLSAAGDTETIDLSSSHVRTITIGFSNGMDRELFGEFITGDLKSLREVVVEESGDYAVSNIPPSIEVLRFWYGHHNHVPVEYEREPGFCNYYNQAMGPLPPTLRVLDFTALPLFNQPLGPLPDTLEELRLGRSFNQPLGALPASLRKLTTGADFDQELLGAHEALVVEYL